MYLLSHLCENGPCYVLLEELVEVHKGPKEAARALVHHQQEVSRIVENLQHLGNSGGSLDCPPSPSSQDNIGMVEGLHLDNIRMLKGLQYSSLQQLPILQLPRLQKTTVNNLEQNISEEIGF